MRAIVAGSRSLTDYLFLKRHLDNLFSRVDKSRLVILSGHAKGADQFAERWCDNNLVTYQLFHPQWDKHGTQAGILRNQEMIDAVGPRGVVIVFWDGFSAGTADTIRRAKKAGLRLRVFRFNVKVRI